jgi:hypothetical protein
LDENEEIFPFFPPSLLLNKKLKKIKKNLKKKEKEKRKNM